MIQGSSKKKQTHYKNDNVLEALGSIPSGVGTNTVSEIGKIGTGIVDALVGSTPRSGDLQPNQAIEFGDARPAVVEQAPIQPMRSEAMARPNVSMIEMETKKQIDAIRAELKSLIISLKNLHQEVQTAVSKEDVDPGVYHLNFYDQLRTFIHVLRQQIEDSRTWLSSFTSRKKKMGYWNMFKKHGTTFGLSNERSIATSAG